MRAREALACTGAAHAQHADGIGTEDSLATETILEQACELAVAEGDKDESSFAALSQGIDAVCKS